MVRCVELLLQLLHEEALLLATKEDDDDNDVNNFFVDIVTPWEEGFAIALMHIDIMWFMPSVLNVNIKKFKHK